MKKLQHALQPGTVIRGTNLTYTVDHVLGSGAYGITYLATTNVQIRGELGTLDTFVHVTLKELFVEGHMTRNGVMVERDSEDEQLNSYARCFYMEADKLAELNHPNIVKVLEVFIANNTCYYTMEYLSGGALNEYIDKKNGLPEAEALKFIRQIGSALSYMHSRKIVHLDVKPLNMVFKNKEQLKLIDYGLSIQYDNKGEAEATEDFGAGTPGYASLEQSSPDSTHQFTPSLGVYGLGASYYKMLTNMTPPRAVEIVSNGINTHPLVSANVSQQSIDAIKSAMNPVAEKRLQTIDEFLAMLPDIKEEQEEGQKGNGKKRKAIIMILLSALAATALLYFLC